MASKKKPAPKKGSPRGARVAIVRARWNEEITLSLEKAAIARAAMRGATVDLFEVPGSFELPAAVALLADTGRYDAIVPIGCLIRGDTPHFDVLAAAVARGIVGLAVTYPLAIPFGVLTCDTVAQAEARAGGSEGNKGTEFMDAALEMVALRQAIASSAASSRERKSARSRSTG
ncbi:MAG TPA: 6,7-dimethyl-8-ribityllumazine synthase [Candidatus Limnocylindrales bacterium]|nr:6,7-dimethyl-8-ribityllumazine synthase [Candidatus Limnocylindrales bacterium]